MREVDCLIVGAGPAGLSAALVLGRCRRSVLVCDAGAPRNAASGGLHGFLTRDGVLPYELRRIAREQLRPYGTVEMRDVQVTDAARIPVGGFEATLADGTRVRSRKIVLATGVLDELPDIEGIRRLYGRSVFHCPYCDGWEMRDTPLAVYGRGRRGVGLALKLTLWTHDIVLLTDGPAGLTAKDSARLGDLAVPVREERIVRVEGTNDGLLERIVFVSGPPLARRGLFFNTGQYQRSSIPGKLGCEVTSKGSIRTGKHESTNVPGVYVIGDASRDVQLSVVAASEGAKAAFAINEALLKEHLDSARRGPP